MKKLLSFGLVILLAFSITACGGGSSNNQVSAPSSNQDGDAFSKPFKMGAVLIGDENEGYTYAHIEGIQAGLKANGLSENDIIWKYSTPEDERSYDACIDLVESGCNFIITNSYSHQSYCQQAAEENPDVEFVAMTGDTAKSSGLNNFHNAFTRIYEARYVGGVVAGMKIKELIDDGKISDKNKDADGNIKVGYVGAYPYAEVVSGYTSFFLGIRSIVPNVTMDVQYTNSWSDITAENEAATKLLSNGCIMISQHADSSGAPSAVEEYHKAGNECYCVGYNIDMTAVAPTSALTSPKNNWASFYTYAIGCMLNGEKPATNWSKGYDEDGVSISSLSNNVAAGTKEKVDEVVSKIKTGELQVFDTSTFTVDGKEVTSAFATDTDGDFTPDSDEAVFDGYYHESYFQSAPSFQLRIDGIHELN